MSGTQSEALLNRYNLLLAQFNELKDRYTESDRAWRQYAKEKEIVDGHMRKFLEMVLAKDRSQMTLGKMKTWSDYSTDDMISQATKSFIEYNQNRTKLMNDLVAELEKRGSIIDTLQAQIEAMMAQGVTGMTSVDDILNSAEKQAADEAAIAKAPNSVRSAAANGEIEVIVQEASDYVDPETGEFEVIGELKRTAMDVTLTPNAPPVAKSAAARRVIAEEKEHAVIAHMTNIREIMDKMSEYEWLVLDIIGTRGLALYTQITKAMTDEFDILDSQIRRAMMSLVSRNALERTKLTLPLSRHVQVLALTPAGKIMFKEHFKRPPVPSETEMVIAEHDNVHHGYGILEIAAELQKHSEYIEVSSYNRKHPIQVSVNGQTHQYVPDIIAKKDKGYIDYFEYERGLHTNKDFAMKCEKLSRITRFLSFIVPNRETAVTLQRQIEWWIEQKGGKFHNRLTIRIASALTFKEILDGKENRWDIEFKTDKNPQLVYNRLEK